jgi:hypothetical protein
MDTATTTTCDVSAVKRATEPLHEVPYKEAVQAQITRGKSRNFRTIINAKVGQILNSHGQPWEVLNQLSGGHSANAMTRAEVR